MTTLPGAVDRPSPRPQRWAVVAAWLSFLSTIPSALWRLLMLYGALPGTAALRALHAGEEGYIWGLSLVQVGLGSLALGLVQRWGERLFGWRIPRWFPVVLGGLGALAVIWLFSIQMPIAILDGRRPDQHTVHGVPLAVMVACYLPLMVLWGPLLLVAVVSYWRRRGAVPHH